MFQEIVFLQAYEAYEVLDILDKDGEEKALKYLIQWDHGEGEYIKNTGIGKDDTIYKKGNYIMSYNIRLGYIGLISKIEEI